MRVIRAYRCFDPHFPAKNDPQDDRRDPDDEPLVSFGRDESCAARADDRSESYQRGEAKVTPYFYVARPSVHVKRYGGGNGGDDFIRAYRDGAGTEQD